MTTVVPRPATTIVLLRDAGAGAEVFLVQRHSKSGFFPSAWVFPGGRVDPGDELGEHPAVRGGEATASALAIERSLAIAYLVAGVRETFEECGIWLGSGAPVAAARGELTRNERSMADVLHASGAVLDLDRLAPWAHWVTPEVEQRRFDTRFFVARADGATGSHDDHETVDSGWFAAADVLQAPTRFSLAPPTWWTLRELAGFRNVVEVFAAVDRRVHTPIQPIIEMAAGGMRLLLPGHPGHPAAAIHGVPTEMLFDEGQWVAVAGAQRLPALPTPST